MTRRESNALSEQEHVDGGADGSSPIDVTVVVPTYCEAENLEPLVSEIHRAAQEAGLREEIIIVDDNSPDETPAVCDKLMQQYPVHLAVRTKERGLSTAVIHGMQLARGDVLVCMDADLSHPPERVPELAAAVRDGRCDFAIGSRYIAGGSTEEDWGLFRQLNSRFATWLSRPLTRCKDPMAGFFALRRETFESCEDLDPIGYKIGLELMVKANCRNVCEIPIHFQDRQHGESKLNLREQVNYLVHLRRLMVYRYGILFRALAFFLIGLIGLVIDAICTWGLLASASIETARVTAISVATLWNAVGTGALAFSELWEGQLLQRVLRAALVWLPGALANDFVSLSSYNADQLTLPWAIVAGTLAGLTLSFLLSWAVMAKSNSQDRHGKNRSAVDSNTPDHVID